MIRSSHVLMFAGHFNTPSGIVDDSHWHLVIELKKMYFNSFDRAIYRAAREVKKWLEKHKQPMGGTLTFSSAQIEMWEWDEDNRPSPVYYFNFTCTRPAHLDPRYDEEHQPARGGATIEGCQKQAGEEDQWPT